AAVPVRLLHRAPGERTGGLGGAVREGLAAGARWTGGMDGDLQHPPERVPGLVAAAERGAGPGVATRDARAGGARGGSAAVGVLARRRRWCSRGRWLVSVIR